MLNKEIKLILEKFDPILNKDGVYSKSGVWNSIKWIGNKAYRERVEVLIFNKNKEVFAEVKNNGTYKLPGGGVEPILGRTNEQQVYEEAKEEARILIKNIRNPEIAYIENIDKLKQYMIDENLFYDGYFTHVYIADFDNYYSGYINPKDEDLNMAKNGKFYNISILTKDAHLQSIKKMQS